MERIINEQKARNIATMLSIDVNTLHEKSCYLGAREMAKWKDQQMLEFLRSLIFQATPESLNTIISNKIKELSNE